MVKLPHGVSFEMQWTQVTYRNHGDFIVFGIIPMEKCPDLIVIPNEQRWQSIVEIFSLEERNDMISALKRIRWKRYFIILEEDIEAETNKEIDIIPGTLESTKAYRDLASDDIFDPKTQMNAVQVHNLYRMLEERFAEACRGVVTISTDTLIEGSVMKDITMKAFYRNPNITLKFV